MTCHSVIYGIKVCLEECLDQRKVAFSYLNINTPVTADGSSQLAKFASSFPTTLRRLSYTEFDKLAAHGAAVAARVRAEFRLL